MNRQASPYIAFTCILAVFESVVLAKTNALTEGSDYIVCWLIYAVACGVIINYRPDISAGSLLLMSLPSPTVIALVYTYEFFFQGEINLSGKHLLLRDVPHFWPELCAAWLFTIVGIWLFGFARPLVLNVIGTATSPQKAGQIEKALNWVTRVGTSAFVIVKAFK